MKMKGVIFDFNGVIIDDYPLQKEAWNKVSLKLRNKPITDREMLQKIRGIQTKNTVRWLSKNKLSEKQIENIAKEKESYSRKLVAKSPLFCLNKGISAFFDALKKNNIPRTIATSANLKNLQFSFTKLGLSKWFDFKKIVYNDDTLKSKPAPDAYLLAAQKINLNPKDCLVFEDAISGIKSAYAAGVRYIVAIGTNEQLAELKKLPGVKKSINNFLGINKNFIFTNFQSQKMKVNSISSQLILQSLQKKGAKVQVLSRRFMLLKVSYKDKFLYIKSTSFPVNSHPSCLISDNKFLTKKIFQKNNIPFPKSFLVRTRSEARKLILKKKLFPCVLKPAQGGHGWHVYANIKSISEFNKLLPLVFTNSGRNNILIEEYVKGKDYRLFVVGDNVCAAIERTAASVVGDGTSNIRKLIRKFNQSPLVGEKFEKPLCKIVIDNEVKRNLKKLGKKLSSIPQKGEKIFLRQNANISTGGTGRDVTDEIPQSVKKIAIRAAKALGMVITGVDMIYDYKSKKAYVLELNATPGIDIHHYPVSGQSRNVADEIADCLIKALLVRRK